MKRKQIIEEQEETIGTQEQRVSLDEASSLGLDIRDNIEMVGGDPQD